MLRLGAGLRRPPDPLERNRNRRLGRGEQRQPCGPWRRRPPRGRSLERLKRRKRARRGRDPRSPLRQRRRGTRPAGSSVGRSASCGIGPGPTYGRSRPRPTRTRAAETRCAKTRCAETRPMRTRPVGTRPTCRPTRSRPTRTRHAGPRPARTRQAGTRAGTARIPRLRRPPRPRDPRGPAEIRSSSSRRVATARRPIPGLRSRLRRPLRRHGPPRLRHPGSQCAATARRPVGALRRRLGRLILGVRRGVFRLGDEPWIGGPGRPRWERVDGRRRALGRVANRRPGALRSRLGRLVRLGERVPLGVSRIAVRRGHVRCRTLADLLHPVRRHPQRHCAAASA